MAKTSKRARRTSTFYLPGAFDLFTTSKDIVLKNIWIFGPLYAVPLIFWIHSWIWSPLPTQKTHWWYNADGFSSGWPGGPVPTYFTFLVIGFSIFWALLIIGVGTIAQIMAQEAQLEGAEHKTIDFNNLWKFTKELGWRMLGLYILVGLVVLVGFILLIIPGLIMIRRYLLAPYVMLDKKVGISEAMSQSAELSKLNSGAIWGIIGVMFLIGLLNVIPIIGGLTSFIVGSLYSVAPALRYTQLKKLAH
jgi:hypothetical protein